LRLNRVRAGWWCVCVCVCRVVIDFRRGEWVAHGGRGMGARGSMRHFERVLRASGMGEYWADPAAVGRVSEAEWKRKADLAVDTAYDKARAERMARMPTATVYAAVKEWGRSSEEYSFSRGEVGKLGQQVPERYLDDRRNLKGTRLKMLCRTGSLPLMVRVGKEVVPKWPREMRTCLACNSGVVEDVRHFVMECPAYAGRRRGLLNQVAQAAQRSDVDIAFDAAPVEEQLHIILGKRVGDRQFEDKVDWQAKKFLVKCWNSRAPITEAVNAHFGAHYGMYRASNAA
jgi:hypothetical protein